MKRTALLVCLLPLCFSFSAENEQIQGSAGSYPKSPAMTFRDTGQELALFQTFADCFLTYLTAAYPKSVIESELATVDMSLKREDYEGALLHLDVLSRIGPDAATYAGKRAKVYRAMGKPELAIPYLEKAAAMRGDTTTRLELAETYKENGEFTKAAGEYGKLLSAETDPNWVRRQIVSLTKQKLLVAESISNSRSFSAAGMQKSPDALLFIAPETRCAVVEKESQTLFLYRGTARGCALEKTFACSTGSQPGEKISEGDERTPEGIYLLRRTVPLLQLPDIYGRKAITLDYPNAFDRMEGKGGDGIWLHATNEPIRAYLPNKTRGCVVVSNEDIEELSALLKLNQTPMLIVSAIRYRAGEELAAELQQVKSFLSEWRDCWENKQVDGYIRLYSRRFRNGNQDVAAWKAYKESVFERAGKIRLNLQLKSVVKDNRYTILTFDQNYRSDRLTSRGTKRLFIVREDGAWKIIAEEMELPQ